MENLKSKTVVNPANHHLEAEDFGIYMIKSSLICGDAKGETKSLGGNNGF